MANEDIMTVEGKIDEILPDGRFSVTLESEHRNIACKAGQMRDYRIRSVVGDRRTYGKDALTSDQVSDRLSRKNPKPKVRRRPTACDHAPTLFQKAAATPLPARIR